MEIVLKSSPERRVFAPLYKASASGKRVLDKHGEFISDSSLYDGVTRFLNEADRKLRLQHSERVIGTVEQVVSWPYEVRLPLHDHRGIQKSVDTFPAGSAFAWVRFTPEAWQSLVVTGKLNGLSVGGSAKRIYADADAPAETRKAARGSLVREAALHGSVRLT